MDNCPDGFWPFVGVCKKCDDNCDKCSNVDGKQVCNHCAEGWFMDLNGCVKECPERFYEMYSTRTCEKCGSGCLGCDPPK